MNPARQAAEVISWHEAYTLATATHRKSDAESCQLISDMLRERIVNGRECERIYKQRTRERDEAREAARTSPAWHPRPTTPGWWVDWKQGEMFYVKPSDMEVIDESRDMGAVYGPIPEPPEPAP